MSCIHSPTEDTTLVHHNARKTGRRSGAQMEVTGRASVVTYTCGNENPYYMTDSLGSDQQKVPRLGGTLMFRYLTDRFRS